MMFPAPSQVLPLRSWHRPILFFTFHFSLPIVDAHRGRPSWTPIVGAHAKVRHWLLAFQRPMELRWQRTGTSVMPVSGRLISTLHTAIIGHRTVAENRPIRPSVWRMRKALHEISRPEKTPQPQLAPGPLRPYCCAQLFQDAAHRLPNSLPDSLVSGKLELCHPNSVETHPPPAAGSR